MRNDCTNHLIGINIVIHDFFLQLILPRFMYNFFFLLFWLLITITVRIETTKWSFKWVLSILFFFFSLVLLYYLIDLEIVLLIRDLLPFWNINSVVAIHIYFLLTYLFELLPLLFLLFAHYVTDRRLILLYLSQVINETRVSRLLADIDSPHLKLFTIWILRLSIWFFVFFLFGYEIFCKQKIFFFWKFDGSSKLTLSPFCDELMNGCLSAGNDPRAIILNLLF